MNRYGVMARRHWQRWLPDRTAQLTDPDNFFSTLGDEVATQIEDLAAALAGDDPPGEDYLTKLGRLRMARAQAEQTVLAERVLLDPEPGTDGNSPEQDPEQDDLELGEGSDEPLPPAAGWVPLTEDPAHPWWQQATEQEDRGR